MVGANSMNYDYYDDDDDGDRRWPKRVALVAVVLLLAAGTAFVLTRSNGRSTSVVSEPVATVASTATTTTSTLYDPFPAVSLPADSSPTDSLPHDSAPVPGTAARSQTSTTLVHVLPPVPPTNTTTTAVPPAANASTTTGGAQNASGTPTTPATSPSVAPGTPYLTLPDGSPQPVVAIFDTSTITLTGELPSQDVATRLEALALANSQTPAAIVNNLIINPGVPLTVGVRVIELNSARFPSGSATILPAHAEELSRVVRVMNALPNVSVLVVGHADQVGPNDANYALSVVRAQAVVNYLIFSGISASRISSRGVGTSDLLTNAGDDVSLALNRRTEFIFIGLLVP
jgi:outer membrane protein OmpA-like peptidoglycan-associated protein